MKITSVEAIALMVPLEKAIVPSSSLAHADVVASVYFREYRTTLVRITTDDGITGVGECMVRLAPTATRDIVDSMKSLLIGRDPREIELIWDTLWAVMMNRGHSRGFFVEALSGIDIALWDILGKFYKAPVYQLIGGKTHKRLWTYASSLRFRGEKALIEESQKYLEAGYRAMKLKIGMDPIHCGPDIKAARALRKAVGDDVTLMADANCGYAEDMKTALYVGKALQDENFYWFEEPISAENVDGYAHLRNQLSVRLAAGEAESTRFNFAALLKHDALDIVQPNACRVGGITEARKVAQMASAFRVGYAPHTGSSSANSLAVGLHLATAMPNFVIYEHMQSDWSDEQRNPLRWDLFSLPVKSFADGYIEIEDKPGLGIELNEEVVRKYRV